MEAAVVVLLAIVLAAGAGFVASRLPQRRTVPLDAFAPAPLLALPQLMTPAPPPGASTVPSSPEPATVPDSPPQASVAATPIPAPSPGPLQLAAGQRVQVGNLSGDACANVRDTPSLTGRVHVCLPVGSAAQIVDGPLDADGYRWWKVDAGGWAAADYLAAVATGGQVAASSAPVPSVAPSLTPSLSTSIEAALLGNAAATFSRAPAFGISGWATYYGIEDGFVRGDVMNDGTPYDPADPTITAASFALPLHTWLKVCSIRRCITVQVRDRGLLDQNGILLDLSRGAYALLFGGLGGKQWISAFPTTPTFPLPPNPVNLTP
jgi:hypothetical protein